MDKVNLLRLIAVEKEIEKRKGCEKLKNYNSGEKVHVKQMEFHKCTKRNRWVFGGNRSGKTECGAVEAVWKARGNHPYKENKPDVCGWVVSLSAQVQREVAQQKLLSYLSESWIQDVVMSEGKKGSPSYGIIDYILIKNVYGGLSKISFKNCEQGREKFQGASLDFVWFDEEPPKDIYEECRMRVLDRCGEIWGTMTPLKGLTWVYDEIYLNSSCDSEIWHINMEWLDNPYLSEKEIKRLSSALSKDSLESRRYGRFNEAEGLVYKEFDERLHVIEPFDIPYDWQDGISIDPGLNNPLACLFFAVDYDGNVFVVAEHYEEGKDINYHSEKIFKLADSLNWHRDSKGRLCAIIDSAASQKTLASQRSVTELFLEKGIYVNPKVNKELFSGINRVKTYLGSDPPKLYIFKNCINLIREIKSYWWGKGDVPKKKDDHALDALRYYIMTKPEPTQYPRREKTFIELDKEKLIKRLGKEKFKKH